MDAIHFWVPMNQDRQTSRIRGSAQRTSDVQWGKFLLYSELYYSQITFKKFEFYGCVITNNIIQLL